MFKKIMCSLLLLTMLLTQVACAKGESQEGTGATEPIAATSTSAITEEVSAETTSGYLDQLPDTLDFKEDEVYILSRSKDWVADEVSVKELTGDLINDAIYTRNLAVEERLNVKIVNVYAPDNEENIIADVIRMQVNSNSDDYDLFAGNTNGIARYVGEGLFQNLRDLTYLDLSQPYWSQGYNEGAYVGDAQYFATGAICLSAYRFVFVTFFNKNLFDAYQLPYLYDTVNEGKWTLDKQYELSNIMYTDLNNDNVKNDKDQFGFITCGNMISVDPYWSSCNLKILSKDADNYYQFLPDIARISDAVDKINRLIWNNEGALSIPHITNDVEQEQIMQMFASDQAGMATLRLLAVENELFRNMTSLYGIVPMPKFDETQTGYYSAAHNQITVYGVPLTVTGEDLEMMGALMEALASESYKTVMPAYYEVALKTKYVSDDESAKMLDKVIDNLYLDAGFFYSDNIPFYKQMRTWIGSNNNNVSSYIKSAQRILDKQVEALNDSFRKVQ